MSNSLLTNLPIKTRVILIISLAFITACGNWLAEDVTPPPAEQTSPPSPSPESISETMFPLVPPSVENGAEIYQMSCQPCHGSHGYGDGPQADDLPNPVTAIGSKDIARLSTPAQWYRVVTEGNLERFMPPFNSLTDRERWDVVAYIYSLSTSEQEQQEGELVYQQFCQECHGENMDGTGVQAAGSGFPAENLADLKYLSGKSTLDFYSAVTEGVGTEMTAFEDQLTEQERWSVSEYLRMVAFSSTDQDAQFDQAMEEISPIINEGSAGNDGEEFSGETSDPSAEFGTVTGTVFNMSSDTVPAGIDVTLFGFDQMQQVFSTTTVVDQDGTFSFPEIEIPPGRVFMVTADHDGITYGSEIVTAQAGGETLELPINLYDTTVDRDKLVTDRLHLFYELLDNSTLRVVELYIVSNKGDKTIVAEHEGEAVIPFDLPDGASALEIEDGEIGDGRFIAAEGGFADTISIRPGMGNYQTMFTYLLPYERKASLSHLLNLPTDAVVVLSPAYLRVRGEELIDAGIRDVQGVEFQMFSINDLQAGDVIDVALSGRLSGSGISISDDSTAGLIIGLGALIIALIGGGIWLYQRNHRKTKVDDEPAGYDEESASNGDSESIMDAIIALDDLYRKGEIPEAAYQQRRADLKAQLKEIMADSADD